MGTANNAGALIRTMLALRAQRKTGVLEIVADDVSTRIFVLKGMPVFAEEGTTGEPLGRLLLRQRVITQEQHVQVIECMTRSLAESEQVRYGEVAVELGFLSQDDLHRGLVDQVRWRIIRVMQRETIEWRFEASEDGLAKVRQLLLQIESLVLDAARTFTDERRTELALAAVMERFPLLIGDPTLVAERFEMNGPESRFLPRVDGARTVSELLAEPRPAGVDVPAILAAVVLTGAAGMVDERHEPAEPREPLPSPPRVRVPAPRPSSPPNSATAARLRASRAVARLKQAREESARFSDHRAEQRAPATEHEARILAEHAFQRGKAYLRANHLGLALPELRRAFELQPESLEYQLYATWVASRSRERPTSEQERAALARLARAAAHHDPSSAFAQYVLGHVALLEGADAEARERFNAALRLDPHAIDAERHIRLLALRNRGKKGSASVPPPAAPLKPLPPRMSEPRIAAAPRVSVEKVEPRSDAETVALARVAPIKPSPPRVSEDSDAMTAPAPPVVAIEARSRDENSEAKTAPAPPVTMIEEASHDEKSDAMTVPAPPVEAIDAPRADAEKGDLGGAAAEEAKVEASRGEPGKSERRLATAKPGDGSASPLGQTDSGSHEVGEEELELVSEDAPRAPPPPPAPSRRSLPPPLPLSHVSSPPPSRPSRSEVEERPADSSDASQGSFWTGVAVVAAAAGIALIVHGMKEAPTAPAATVAIAATSSGASGSPASMAAAPAAPEGTGADGVPASVATSSARPALDAGDGTPPLASAASSADAGHAADAAQGTVAVAPPPSAQPLDPGPGGGVLLLPRSAEQHRIYVDGKLASHGSAPIRVTCGRHTVQIGSAGKTRDLDVPCGGEIEVGPQ